MKDYYKILNIEKTKPSTTTYSVQIVDDDIKLFYKKKILVFKDLPFLTKQMILDIKDIKEAYYVLSDKTRKAKYDKKIHTPNEEDTHTKICNRLFSLTFGK